MPRARRPVAAGTCRLTHTAADAITEAARNRWTDTGRWALLAPSPASAPITVPTLYEPCSPGMTLRPTSASSSTPETLLPISPDPIP